MFNWLKNLFSKKNKTWTPDRVVTDDPYEAMMVAAVMNSKSGEVMGEVDEFGNFTITDGDKKTVISHKEIEGG